MINFVFPEGVKVRCLSEIRHLIDNEDFSNAFTLSLSSIALSKLFHVKSSPINISFRLSFRISRRMYDLALVEKRLNYLQFFTNFEGTVHTIYLFTTCNTFSTHFPISLKYYSFVGFGKNPHL